MAEAPRADDLVQPFHVAPFPVRGRLVRLGAVADEIIGRHGYPDPVAALMAEAMALASLLASTLKYDGVFSLQAQGDGAVRVVVVDVTSDGDIRGYAQFDDARLDDARLADLGVDTTPDAPPMGLARRLLGKGHLAFTVARGANQSPYQGIVELRGKSLVDCVDHYFQQSEQIETAIRLAVGRMADAGGVERWRAAALMIQRLPEDTAEYETGLRDLADGEWRDLKALVVGPDGGVMLDRAIAPAAAARQILASDRLAMHPARPLRAGCRCSEARVRATLRALPRDEIESLTIDGEVVVTCEFCAARYAFDEIALARLYAS